jgi:DNA repair exonuclease SbcCD ATPase subunit
MKHLNISDDAMKIILENAAWSDFGLKVNKTQDQKIDESTEEVEEEAHVCPLCSSHLDEAISDEALMEHTANVLEAVNAATLNEEEEEEDGEELYEEDESEDEDDEEDFDDEDEQIEEGKMPHQLKKAKGKMGKKGMKYK